MTATQHTNHPGDIEKQLADLERQGGSMARLAHLCAGTLLLVFSAGSLISLSYAALQTLIRTWDAGHGVDIPNLINTLVNPLLVLAMDVAMLYAASVLRVLTSGRAPREEMRVHVAIMAGASMLESATYLYMTWQFDRPQNGWLWVIAVGRAVAAPLFAVYLSMARPLPVAPRDVAYQTSLHSGRGVIRDVATLAADPSAPLHRKVRIYSASSRMTEQDAAQFAGIIAAVSDDDPAPGEERVAAPTAQPVTFRSNPGHVTPVTPLRPLEHGGDDRSREWDGWEALPPATFTPALREPQPYTQGDSLDALVERAGAMRSNVRAARASRSASMATLTVPQQARPKREEPKRGDIGMSQQARLELAARRKAAARKILAADPAIGARDFARRIAMATKHSISPSTAQTILAELRAEMPREDQPPHEERERDAQREPRPIGAHVTASIAAADADEEEA